MNQNRAVVIGSTLKTERLILRPLDPKDAPLLARYVKENKDWLAPWEPTHQASYYTHEGQRNLLYQCQEDRLNKTGVLFGVFEQKPFQPEESRGREELLGRVSISGIVRGIWQNGFVGYSIAGSRAGRGYMTEALRRVTHYGLTELRLHRLQASIIPRNAASLKVVKNCRYRYEGRSLSYLKIKEVWEDHDIFALTQEELRNGYP